MDNNVTEAVCQARLKTADEHFKRVDKRLEKGEEKIDKVSEAIVLLTEMVKQTKDELSDHDKRIETLEHRPNLWLDRAISWAGSALIGGLIGILFNILG